MWEYGKKEDFFAKDTSCKGREEVWWALVVEQRGTKNFSRKIHCVRMEVSIGFSTDRGERKHQMASTV